MLRRIDLHLPSPTAAIPGLESRDHFPRHRSLPPTSTAAKVPAGSAGQAAGASTQIPSRSDTPQPSFPRLSPTGCGRFANGGAGCRRSSNGQLGWADGAGGADCRAPPMAEGAGPEKGAGRPGVCCLLWSLAQRVRRWQGALKELCHLGKESKSSSTMPHPSPNSLTGPGADTQFHGRQRAAGDCQSFTPPKNPSFKYKRC